MSFGYPQTTAGTSSNAYVAYPQQQQQYYSQLPYPTTQFPPLETQATAQQGYYTTAPPVTSYYPAVTGGEVIPYSPQGSTPEAFLPYYYHHHQQQQQQQPLVVYQQQQQGLVPYYHQVAPNQAPHPHGPEEQQRKADDSAYLEDVFYKPRKSKANDPLPYVCDQCKKRLQSKAALMSHKYSECKWGPVFPPPPKPSQLQQLAARRR
eukprot:TRINITY_DN662_c0_g1_i1.p2 TRINITY_DN662_c0_g1~~TRINITY_DN662_c0_g1_i1.p2  ORF type:complete len:206 (-),score=58.13 TRINITY_DN662_c0_g1_i1:236-853(-)